MGEWGRLGAYVRDERRRRGQTQREFAGRVGLSVRTVGALERGELDRYDANTLALVELALAWRPGSAEHVLAGGKPKTADPHLAAIRAAWPRLSREAREMLARLATDIADHHPR